MSIPTTESTPVTPATPATPTPKPTDTPDVSKVESFDAEYVSKLRNEAAKYRTEAKANADAAAKLAAIEEANKTEAQKLADQLAAAKREASDAKREAFAATKQIPASLIHGSTPEEWEASAAEALAWKGETPPAPRGPVVPGEGTAESKSVAQISDNDLKSMTPAQINQARREGRLNRLLGIN